MDLEELEDRMKTLKASENYEDEKTSELFNDIDAHVRNERSTELIDLLLQCELVELVQKMWRKYFTQEQLEKMAVLPDHLSSSLAMIWHLSNVIDEVCERIVEIGLHDDIFKNLRWKTLSAATLNDPKLAAKRVLANRQINILHNVVRKTDTARGDLRKHGDVASVLQKFRDVTKYQEIVTETMMLQSYFITGDVNKENNEVFKTLVNALRDIVGYGSVEVNAVVEILKAINNLAVIDENSEKIVEAGALRHYVKLLKHDDETVQREAARGLWMLAFRCKDNNSVKETGCVEALKSLEKSASSDKVRATAAGALWILENKKPGPPQPVKDGTLVMISYQLSSKLTALKIGERLKAAGFRTWIDVENKSDSPLESKARAIDQAGFVLLCISERYKEDPGCRTDAEYANNQRDADNQRKPIIIPLLVEAGFKPDGWLNKLCQNNDCYGLGAEEKFDDEWSKLYFKLCELIDSEGMKQWIQRLKTLKQKENFEDEETTKLLDDINALAIRPASKEKTKLFGLLLDCDFVQLVQEMWRRSLSPDHVAQMKQLPAYLSSSMHIMWSASAENDEICKRIIKTGLHADMLKNLSWDTLSAATLDDDRSHAERTVVGLQISILHNVVRRTESARAALRKCQAVAVVQKFRGVKKDLYKDIVMRTIMLQSYLITDDNRKLLCQEEVFDALVVMLHDAIHGKAYYGYIYPVISVIKALNNLAVTDENKVKIVEAGALPHYVKLLSPERDEAVQIAAAHGFWLLAFKCKCKENINKEPEYLEALRTLEKTTASDKVREKVSGALWILENKAQQPITPTPSKPDKRLVIISYHSEFQLIVLKIRDQLKAAFYRVWINIEHLSDGSLMESMAPAIQQAAVVLVCFLERYKDSPNCRTEAEYAHNDLKKPIILPIQLEAGCKPDDWLGQLFSNTSSHDFSASEKFGDAWSKLQPKLPKP